MGDVKKIRILSVDDHAIVRRGIAAIIATEPSLQLIGEASSAEDAILRYRELQPEVVLMDLRLGGRIDGVEAIERICKEWPRALILVLTTYAGDENIHRALDAGARGYLIKDSVDDQELVNAISAVRSGRLFIPAKLAIQLVEQGKRVELTPREREVLLEMAQGLRNKEIAARLNISEATTRTHVDNIVGKLGASSRTEAVVSAAQRGFLNL
ncbi:two-component response regulator [Acidisarcina polymorpha]|uniref:Two-component response regulator n=1 Tax=Acidisarcina polymorpha TaxID=2211140 RepID=A0A2Z5G451_9BACT|nr:response regulator transcription factor [Acidisarcina polymorpha]AXC13851.1 two-component response regulator [Acidisarcina polymorpha]